MDGISSLGSIPLAYAPLAADGSGFSATATDSIGPAATLELSTLQLQTQMVSTLFSGLASVTSLGSRLDVRV